MNVDDKAFDEFLEHADKVVRIWPLWKQTLLGGTGKREEPREPVDNFKQVADCLRDENRVLKQTNESLRIETVGLYKAIAEQKAEIERLQKANDQLQQEKGNLSITVDCLLSDKRELKRTIDELNRRYHQQNQTILERECKIVTGLERQMELNQQLTAEQQKSSQLSQQVESLKQQSEDLRGQISDLDRRHAERGRTILDREDALNKLWREKDAIEKKKEDLTRALHCEAERFTEKETEFAELEVAYMQLATSISATDREALRRQVELLTQQLAAMTADAELFRVERDRLATKVKAACNALGN